MLKITRAGLLSGLKPGNSLLYCFSFKASASFAYLPGLAPLILDDFAALVKVRSVSWRSLLEVP
jgi:hypothetical protein